MANTSSKKGNGPTDPREREVLKLLREKFDKERDSGKMTSERAETVAGMLDNLDNILGGGDDIGAIMKSLETIESTAKASFEILHYPSYGIDRPPHGSRAAILVEICWVFRLFLLEEKSRRGKSESERKTTLDLITRSADVDKRIYQAGSDDSRAVTVDQEVLRPFGLAVREFAARHHSMLVKPIWSGAAKQTSTNAILYMGPANGRRLVDGICSTIGFELMSIPSGKIFNVARWEQLQKAYLAIFDLRSSACINRAAVAYELGIARTLGKPVIVIVSKEQGIPFDIDVQPLLLSGSSTDKGALAEAIDLATAWKMVRPSSSRKSIVSTIEDVLQRYPIPQADTYVNQTLKQLAKLKVNQDPDSVSSMLKALISFLKEDRLMLIHPVWPPCYSNPGRRRLFHVMPFQPKQWANEIAQRVESICKAVGVQYVRGDKVKDNNIIGSIWKEINLASHVLVDLTNFNENVALELGIAHTLGRPTVMVGQGDTVKRLFPMIAKLRFYPYENASSVQLDNAVYALIN